MRVHNIINSEINNNTYIERKGNDTSEGLEPVESIEESVIVEISEEGKKRALQHQEGVTNKYVSMKEYNPQKYYFNYFSHMLCAMADIDPMAYAKFRTIEKEENGQDGNKISTQYFKDWKKANEDKIKAWQEKGLAGSEFERKYDAELYISDGDRGDTMFSHIRTMPTRTVMELSAEQYMRIHDQGDKGLTKLLEDSLKSADEIAKRLDEKGEERLYQARIGFTLNDDGTTTYYVHAKDDNTPADEHTTAHIYASKDIDELVQNVINKENGMSHFQYID